MVLKCKRCNRKLENEQSIKLGYGSTCYKKVFGKTIKVKKLKDNRGLSLFNKNIYK